MYRRILVPVDGSGPSMRGLQEAVRLAQVTGARLKLIHVVNEFIFDPVYAPVQLYEPVLESMCANGRKILDEAAAVVRAAGVEVEPELIETVGGSVSKLILEAVRSWPADLIVMGTHGRRGARRAVLGSDAEMVLRTSTVPLLLVRDVSESA
ncbi:universal stress protein [Povalibacter sp.]|uniref:universal stress protein n=1 Tax=Povalibacter sp. TaxID=1962978 RepID=UPI002F4120F6